MHSTFRSLRYVALIFALTVAILGCKLAEGNVRVPAAVVTPADSFSTQAAADSDTPTAGPVVDTTQMPPATVAAALLTQQAPLSETAAPPATDMAPTPTLEPFTPSPKSIAHQMDVFNEVWDTVNEHYLYPDFNGLDWNQVKKDMQAKIESGLRDSDFYLEMYKMIASLGDNHSTFFDPEAAKAEDEQFQGEYNYGGIGVLTTVVTQTKSLSVLIVFPNSPAEAAGIQMHDRILSADGQPLIDDQGVRIFNLRGPAGSQVTLDVQTPGQAARSLTITREQINSSMPVPHQVLTTPGGKRIGYIFIPTFNDRTIAESIGAAIEDMAQGGDLDGYILDNRYNSGGASTVTLNTLAYFTDGQVGWFVERNERAPLDVQGQDIGGSQTAPVVALVGRGTASFGEIFSGILKDLGRATLMGVTTDGNVEILSIFNFSDGSRAWIATSTFKPLNDENANWEDTGIVPDVSVDSQWDDVTLTTDPVITTALASFDQ